MTVMAGSQARQAARDRLEAAVTLQCAASSVLPGHAGIMPGPVSSMLPPDAARYTGLRSVRGHGGWLL